jgi:hypothetical protein
MEIMIDWSKPIEAVHTDGRVVAVDRRDTTKRNETTWLVQLDGKPQIVWSSDGRTVYKSGWSLRNVEPTSNAIDWDADLVAVHTDGRVVPVEFASRSSSDTVHLKPLPDTIWHNNGLAWGQDSKWSIHNVEPTLHTSDEALRRMEALVERIANGKVDQNQTPLSVAINSELLAEARAIQVLREPVDPRLDKVRAALLNDMPQLADATARRMARDVLAALDA